MLRNIISFFAITTLVTACGVAEDSPERNGLSAKGDNVSPTEIHVTEDMNGQTIQAAVGDRITVLLDGNPTTGYKWLLKTNSRSLPLQSSGYIQGNSDPLVPNPGAGGIYYFGFMPDSFADGGTFILEFAYARSWEPAEQKTFSFTLQVGQLACEQLDMSQCGTRADCMSEIGPCLMYCNVDDPDCCPPRCVTKPQGSKCEEITNMGECALRSDCTTQAGPCLMYCHVDDPNCCPMQCVDAQPNCDQITDAISCSARPDCAFRAGPCLMHCNVEDPNCCPATCQAL